MSLLDQLHSMPTLGCALPWKGFVRYRQSGAAHQSSEAIVLLHGIGSGSGSWIRQLQAAEQLPIRLLAWDAPGYADSSALTQDAPQAQDYAQVLWAWLDELKITRLHLVGHSLGCIMAASAARMQPQRVLRLTLLAPAQGYGAASQEVQQKKTEERLQAMQQLGLHTMARQRAPRLLSPEASSEELELAEHMMSHLNEGGYAQATRMLSGGDVLSDLQAFRKSSAAPIQVACGQLDVITPPQACQKLAQQISAPYTDVGVAGHLCALQAAQAVNTLILDS
jgi:pimeloyl-ACP methyl ester carboxylesterase